MTDENPKPDRSTRTTLLRRMDQAVIATFLLVSLWTIAGYWVAQG